MSQNSRYLILVSVNIAIISGTATSPIFGAGIKLDKLSPIINMTKILRNASSTFLVEQGFKCNAYSPNLVERGFKCNVYSPN